MRRWAAPESYLLCTCLLPTAHEELRAHAEGLSNLQQGFSNRAKGNHGDYGAMAVVLGVWAPVSLEFCAFTLVYKNPVRQL